MAHLSLSLLGPFQVALDGHGARVQRQDAGHAGD